MAISIENYRTQPTASLESALEALSELDDDASAELAEAIEDELSERELEDSLPAYCGLVSRDDDDSLEDRGIFLGSYAS